MPAGKRIHRAAGPRGAVFLAISWILAAAVAPGRAPVPGTGGLLAAPAQGQAKEEMDDEERERRLEELRALGYIAWDTGADDKLSGVTKYDQKLAAPGYNLYSDLAEKIHLMDLRGQHVHTWSVPGDGRQCQHAELLPDGGLVVMCVGHGVMLLDWNSRILFDQKMSAHHDVAPLPGGGFLVPFNWTLPYKGRQVLFDGIATLSARGEILSRWSTFSHLRELQALHAPSRLDEPHDRSKPLRPEDDKGFDYYHMNAVKILPETPLGKADPRFRAGNLLVELRNVNMLLVLDGNDYSILWHWGTDVLDFPHTPSMLDNGHILLFDNGTHRGASRVLEIEPPSGKIVWKYEGKPPESLFSRFAGDAQRLDNGNTLVCESQKGHVFEVTPDGNMVWEYWNPELFEGKRKRFYRFDRLSPNFVEPLLKQHAAAKK